MRAIQIAILVMCIQLAGAIITATGLFTGNFYESKMLPSSFGTATAQSEAEQTQVSFNVMNALWNMLAWGWISHYFEPLYSNVASVTATVDAVIWSMNIISWVLIGVAFIQFIRNLQQPLSGG